MTVRSPLLSSRSSGRIALVLAAVGIAYRVRLVAVGAPPPNSDEATMGLAALHIVHGTGFPAMFYGQGYMGTAEAYLAAPLLWAFGPHFAVLRLVTLLLYAALALVVYVLIRELCSPAMAAVAVLLLSFGSDRVVKDQLIVAGGYPELVPGVALLFLLSIRLALGKGSRGWQLSLSGVLAGFLLWDDWLVAPYVLGALAIVMHSRRSVLADRSSWLLAGGAAVGLAPLVAYNIGASGSLTSWAAAHSLSGTGTGSFTAHLHGAIDLGLPLAVGVCNPGHCTGWQAAWGYPILVLLVGAAVLQVAAFARPAWRSGGGDDDGDDVLGFARVALLGAALLNLLLYAVNRGAANTPIESARYLSAVIVALPVALWPGAVGWSRLSLARVDQALAGVIALLAVSMAVASWQEIRVAPSYTRLATSQSQLADQLRSRGISAAYSDYWTCDVVAFLTDQQTKCAVLADDLRLGLNRIASYPAVLLASPEPAYVAPIGSPLDRAFATAVGQGQMVTAGGYHIYQPGQRLAGIPVPG